MAHAERLAQDPAPREAAVEYATVSRPGVAVSGMPLENRRAMLSSLAVSADRLGYDGFFLPETWAYDTTVLRAEAAVRTERITLGTGILGVWNRSAATIAGRGHAGVDLERPLCAGPGCQHAAACRGAGRSS